MEQKKYDVVVVGSGPGGAAIAHKLSKKGKCVLILEAGPSLRQGDLGKFSQVVWRYYHRFGALSRSKEGTIIYHTRNEGGTSPFICGNMVRAMQPEFLQFGIDLEGPFLESEREINVKSLPTNKIVTGTKAIVEATQALGYNMVPMLKGHGFNAQCNLCGNCVLGCAQDSKWDARDYIQKAIQFGTGTELRSNTKVQQVLFSGDQVRGVKIKGDKDIECGLVILAAGGLGTPVILQKSDISAGSGLFIDPFNVTYGIVDGLSQTKGMSMGAVYKDSHEKEGFVLSPFLDHWSQFSLFCPAAWNLHHHFPLKRCLGIMCKITDERKGKVNLDGSVNKRLTEQDNYRLESGAELAEQILVEAGATDIVVTKHARGAHPGGTCAIDEVVNKDLSVKGTSGLYVSDCSVFPQTPGLPPVLTIVALSKWLGERL